MESPVEKSLPTKLGIKPGSTVAVVDPPPGIRELLVPWPEGAESVPVSAKPDVALFFVRAIADLEPRYAELGEAVRPDGSLWICWPKRTSGLATDLGDGVIRASSCRAGSSTRRSARSTGRGPACGSCGGGPCAE